MIGHYEITGNGRSATEKAAAKGHQRKYLHAYRTEPARTEALQWPVESASRGDVTRSIESRHGINGLNEDSSLNTTNAAVNAGLGMSRLAVSALVRRIPRLTALTQGVDLNARMTSLGAQPGNLLVRHAAPRCTPCNAQTCASLDGALFHARHQGRLSAYSNCPIPSIHCFLQTSSALFC